MRCATVFLSTLKVSMICLINEKGLTLQLQN